MGWDGRAELQCKKCLLYNEYGNGNGNGNQAVLNSIRSMKLFKACDFYPLGQFAFEFLPW